MAVLSAGRRRWRGLLERASLDAQRAVERVAADGKRSTYVGTGASGDRTLLADKKAEEAILGGMSGVPGLRILSEEAGERGPSDSELLAIVDPLDGSSNYSHGIPFYCASVGVLDGRGLASLRVALVRNLVNGDVYYAEKGKGATKNGLRISTSRVADIHTAVAGADLSRTSRRGVERQAGLVSSVARQVHLGANALELCLLAEGAIDLVVDSRGRARVVDFAGGGLIAKEAGAVITTPQGGALAPPISMTSRFDFVASANPELHRKALSALRS